MVGMSAIGGTQARAFQPPSFSSLDTNSDDGISLDELKSNAPGGASDARAEELFNSLDADGDGSITKEEKDNFDSEIKSRMASVNFEAQLIGGRPPDAQSIISALDADDDGAVSLEEFSNSEATKNLESDTIEQLFASIDQDGDGLASEEEISSLLEKGPPPGGPPPSAEATSTDEEEEDTATSQLLEMISNAIDAYQSSSTDQDSLTSVLFDALEDAA